MSKKLFFIGMCLFATSQAFSQNIRFFETDKKWSGEFDTYFENQASRVGRSNNAITNDSLLAVNVNVTDADAVYSFITNEGYSAEIITPEIIIAHLPIDFIKVLAQQDNVKFIQAPRQLKPFMNNVRTETGATKVVSGEGLDTPYDGTGVIIGVIDQGFEYKHGAFSGRVKRWGSNATTGGLRTTAPSSDSYDQVGHATHVANIAAGSQVSNSPYYGIATGAELVLISSDLADNSIILQSKAIKDYANSEGKPWVINMSFGSNVGSHDGESSFDQTMKAMTEPGGIYVAAMGNSGGQKIHAGRTFTENNQSIYLYIKPTSDNANKYIYSAVYSNSNDGSSPLTITPVVFYGGKFYTPTTEQLRKAGFGVSSGIESFSGRQRYQITGYIPSLLTALGLNSSGTAYLLWKVTGKAGDGFHAWVDPDNDGAEFASCTRTGTDIATGTSISIKAEAGDDTYLVGEGGASIPTAIAVASYNNTSVSFTSMNGSSYTYASAIGQANAMSAFSSKGPQLNNLPKPTISAPGGCITSAYSKKSENFTVNEAELVAKYGNNFYYGVMSGTSMACPVVTGIVALWLQANPTLTYQQIFDIMQQTSRHDSYTGTADANGWNATSGYGKIDAYEGLKQALLLKDGINEVYNTDKAVTLNKTNNAWKVLFNNDETYADIQVVNLNGQVVANRHIESPKCGDETIVNLEGFTPGVYVFHVNTTAGNLSRKLVVK